jgi:hypothetical protein
LWREPDRDDSRVIAVDTSFEEPVVLQVLDLTSRGRRIHRTLPRDFPEAELAGVNTSQDRVAGARDIGTHDRRLLRLELSARRQSEQPLERTFGGRDVRLPSCHTGTV